MRPHEIVGRRTLVRAGAATAWTAPLVLTSVPASPDACSGGPAACTIELCCGSITNGNGTPGPVTVAMNARVTNQGGVPAVLGSVTLSMVQGTTGFSSFTFTPWGTATASPAAASLSLQAPTGETLDPGKFRDYPITLVLPRNDSVTVRVTCTASCAPAFSATWSIFPAQEPV